MVGPGKGGVRKKPSVPKSPKLPSISMVRGKNAQDPPIGASPRRSARIMPSVSKPLLSASPRRSIRLTPKQPNAILGDCSLQNSQVAPNKPNPPFQLRDEDTVETCMQQAKVTRVRRTLNLTLDAYHHDDVLSPMSLEQTNEEEQVDDDSHQQEQCENSPHQQTSSENTSRAISSTRGPTRNLKCKRKGRLNEKIVIEVNENARRFVGEDSQQVITKGGCIVRQFAKYDGTTWKNQPQELKDEIIAKCMENSNYDGSEAIKKAFRTQLGSQHRNRQYRLHLHFKKFSSKEEAMRHPPTSVKEDEWIQLCERFSSEKFQVISQKNKGNRAVNNTPPAVGSVSIARIVDNLTKKEGRQLTEIDQYEIGHYSRKKRKMVNDNAQRTLDELRHEESTSSSSPIVICKKILHHIPGHLKGRAVPQRPRMTTQDLRNEVETEKRRADDAIEHNTVITAKVAAQEAELNAVKDQLQLLMAQIARLSSLQGEKD